MTKRKNKNNKIIPYLAAILGLIAVLVIFLPAFQYEDESFTGVQTAFGYTEETEGILSFSVEILKINYLSLIAYMLPIAGILFALVGRNSRAINLAGVVAFIVAGVCAFLSATTFPDTIIGSSLITLDWKLAYGMIISGISSLAAGVSLLYKSIAK